MKYRSDDVNTRETQPKAIICEVMAAGGETTNVARRTAGAVAIVSKTRPTKSIWPTSWPLLYRLIDCHEFR